MSEDSSESDYEDARDDAPTPPPIIPGSREEEQEEIPAEELENIPPENVRINEEQEQAVVPPPPPAAVPEQQGGLNAQEIVHQVMENVWPLMDRILAVGHIYGEPLPDGLDEDDDDDYIDDDGMDNVEDGYFDEEENGDQQEQQDENNPLIGNEENIVPPADFDLQLPGRHSYLGEGMEELQGRVLFDDGGPTPEIPLIVMGIQLVPGQTLPLTIFHAVFQNAIRRCIGTNKVFGIVHNELDTSSGSAVYNGAFGTIAEIYEFQEESDPPNGHPMGLSTFALKAKGRQRFNVISFRRQADGNLMGMVRVRPEIRLPPMVQSVMLGQTHRYRYPIKRQYEDVSMDESGAENNEPTTRKLAKLLSISSNSSSKEDDALVDADLAKMRAEILDKRKMTKFYSAFTPFPYFVYEQFDESVLVERIHRKLRIDLKGLTDSSRIPKDATELSFWLAQNLTMDDHHRMRILKMDSPVSRLRYELDLLSRACKVITCRKCQTSIAESTEIFSMSVEGPQGTYVNPQGFVHETLTVHKTKREVVLRGRSSTEASWFPGYSWTIAECRRCLNHLGWKFKAVGRLKPQQFWGLSRRSISFKYNFLTEEETAAAAEFNTRSRNQSTSEASMSS